jgi:radical SAM superfamily enzyme YgiQ (UPF0313 family)
LRISIISTNREKFPKATIPIGAASIAAMLLQCGHQVEIHDLCFQVDIERSLVSHLDRCNPELVGISLRNTENNEMFYYRCYLEETKKLVETIRKHSRAELVVGGSGFTLFPGELLEYLDLSYGIAGEGEVAFPSFVQYLKGEGELESVPGICHRGKNSILVSSPARVPDFRALPVPAYDLLDLAPYLAATPALPIEGRRGCDLACSFCTEGVGKGGCRLRLPRLIVDEMQHGVETYGIRQFSFVDGIFSFPASQALAICQEITRRDLDVSWDADINPLGVSKDLVASMKMAGCRFVALGIDSASDEMLNNYRKGFVTADIIRTMSLLNEAGLDFGCWILFGGPGENMHTVRETLDFLRNQPGPVFFRVGVRIFKGTELERQAKQEGSLEVGHDMLSPTFYLSRDLRPDFMEWLDTRCEFHENWFTITRAVRQGLV